MEKSQPYSVEWTAIQYDSIRIWVKQYVKVEWLLPEILGRALAEEWHSGSSIYKRQTEIHLTFKLGSLASHKATVRNWRGENNHKLLLLSIWWEIGGFGLKKGVWSYVVEGLINHISEPELHLLDHSTFSLCKLWHCTPKRWMPLNLSLTSWSSETYSRSSLSELKKT